MYLIEASQILAAIKATSLFSICYKAKVTKAAKPSFPASTNTWTSDKRMNAANFKIVASQLIRVSDILRQISTIQKVRLYSNTLLSHNLKLAVFIRCVWKRGLISHAPGFYLLAPSPPVNHPSPLLVRVQVRTFLSSEFACSELCLQLCDCFCSAVRITWTLFNYWSKFCVDYPCISCLCFFELCTYVFSSYVCSKLLCTLHLVVWFCL